MAVTAHRTRPRPTRRRPEQASAPLARQSSAQSSAPQPGRCRRCGGAVIGCLDPNGTLVAVHPVAVVGGELVVNGSQNQIVLVLSQYEAAAAGRRNQLGFTVHDRVCQKVR